MISIQGGHKAQSICGFRVKSLSKLLILGFLFGGVFLRITLGDSDRHLESQAKSQAKSQELTSKILTPAQCIYQTPEQWQKFLETAAENKKWVDTCEDGPCDTEYIQYVIDRIQSIFESCKDYINHHDTIARCTKNMRNFTLTWLMQHDEFSYGFTVDNHTYLAEQESVERPRGMMRPPDEIVAALPSLEKVESAARTQGWKYLTHDSALGGFRTFVVVSDPQGKFDQWMLLNLQTGKNSLIKDTPMSLISVQKKDAKGKPLTKVQIHFRDYSIQHRKGSYRLELQETSNGKCYSCHTNGMRQLIARRTPILQGKPVKGEPGYDETGKEPSPEGFAYKRLMEFNRRIRTYGSPNWDGKIIPENHGPMLGKDMGCTDCHDGKSRGFLNASVSHVQLVQKVVHELVMPPHPHLVKWLERRQMKQPKLSSKEEEMLDRGIEVHKNLAREFEESRFPTLKKWFLETPCRTE